ncbi:MAG TPA: hypothetical protein VJ725_12320 [Thermoanaerobaculia bacterium]|nr:hypothetical protein [Thermoanaerobaculia bacterium]
MRIADETTQAGNGGEIKATPVWQKAAVPVLQLERRGLLECYAYLLAARAGYAGAKEWLEKNPQKKQALDAALRELAG